MRLHVVSLPHTQTTHQYLHCAYTQKVVKFAKMMSREHEVILYSGEENDATCHEHVPLLTEAERSGHYGEWSDNGLFENLDWSPETGAWPTMNARAIAAIQERAEPQDTLCLVAGWSQKPIADALPHLLPVEWAVGYEGISLRHRVFESYAWMHHVYGLRGIRDGVAFDAVIPNFFDPEDFYAADPILPGDDLLFIGRIVQRKGPQVAADIAERCGRKLIVAGPGATYWEPGKIVAPEITITGPVEYVGPVGAKERAELMGRAAAVIVPTQYIEPFGGVAVEAMMCGTPAVTTDWGAFPETVLEGVSGYRFRTLAEGAKAVEDAVSIDPMLVRSWAENQYSLDAVFPQFDHHFKRLNTLWRDGWYE